MEVLFIKNKVALAYNALQISLIKIILIFHN